MKIISIANQKGGCGKTTTSINLAAALGLNGKRVLLFDLDPQAHATLGLNIDGQDSIYNVISKLTPRKLKIENIIKRVEERFDIVPSNILVGTLEQELADEIGRELKLLEVIQTVSSQYDYILIDCPPSLGILTINSIRASDELIIPVETSRFSLQGVDHLLDIVHLIKDRLNHSVKGRVLVTMFDSRLRHSFAMLSTIKERFRGMLFETIVHTNVKLKESAVMGQTVSMYDKYCRGAKDYNTLATEMIVMHKPIVLEDDVLLSGFSPKMQSLIQREIKELLKTRFVLEASNARSVYVTGSFNDWSLDEACKMSQVNGQWVTDLPLKPGVYKYQFIVDGVWRDDPKNTRRERNSFGDINSLVEVKADESVLTS